MSAHITRRNLLRYSAWSAAGLAGFGKAALAASLLQIPSKPMLLKRKLVRQLHDGEAIVVTRNWQVGFSRQGRSYAVMGRQLSAHVDAPAKLKALADIEKARVDEAMFPLTLSDAGTIMAGGRGRDAQTITKVIAAAEELIARSPRSEAGKRQAMLDIQRIQQASQPLFDTLPRDLLFPHSAPVREIRAINMPGDVSGEFELTYVAKAKSDTGWLDQAERKIVTRVGSDERVSSELWTMRELAQ